MKRGKAEQVVFLGDLVDDWYREYDIELYQQTFDRLEAFLDTFPNTLLCWGNHDYGYIYNKPQSGFSATAAYTVVRRWRDIITKRQLPRVVHRVDNVLFSHAGVTHSYMKHAGSLDAIEHDTADSLWLGETPLWTRLTQSHAPLYKPDKYFQVVGHTPVSHIGVYNGALHTDVFSTTVYGEQIGESGFVIVDTTARKWHTVKIKTPQ